MTKESKRYEGNPLACRYCEWDRLFKTKQGLGSHKSKVHGIIKPRIGNY